MTVDRISRKDSIIKMAIENISKPKQQLQYQTEPLPPVEPDSSCNNHTVRNI